MPDKHDFGYLPTTPQTRVWLLAIRHHIERVSFGDENLVKWWDEIVTASKRVHQNKPGEYKAVDMLVKSAMLKIQGEGDFASEVFRLSDKYQAQTPPKPWRYVK